MRIFLIPLVWLIFSISGSAYGQASESQVRRAIVDYQQGTCSDVLSITVKYECSQTIEQYYRIVRDLGPLISLNYLGIEQTPKGPADAFLAKHENGEMLWLGMLAPDGKLSLFWSPGPPA